MANHFLHGSAAVRYARSRPLHQHVVVDRINRYLRFTGPSRRALDAGCGTGLSTLALTRIARNVVGIDSSREMLAHAPKDDLLSYVHARAETLPFTDSAFKLVTVSSAFHWFEREAFLAEAARVLSPGGWLIVYNNAFHGIMRENEAFHAAFRQAYPKRYPTPKRDWRPLTAEQAAPHGLDFRHAEEYSNDVSFSPEELIEYLSTQTNVIAAVEERGEKLEDVFAWLTGLVTPFFPAPRATFEFGGLIWYLRRT